MKNSITLLVLILTCSVVVMAQTNEREAYNTYKQAREAYEQKDYEQTVELLGKTKRLLGETNIRIQPMLIRSLVAIQDWKEAEEQLTAYHLLEPDKSLVEYREMQELERKVVQKVADDERSYQDAKSSTSITIYKQYLSDFPYGKYRTEVSNLLIYQKDKNAWEVAQKAGTTAAYYVYLDQYPSGNFASEARETIHRWDDAAYEKAKTDGSQDALNYYLSNYPRGSYRDEVEDLLEKRKDSDLYMAAKNSNVITDYENYLRVYPNGDYAFIVKQVIQNTYFKFANDDFKEKNYYSAKQYYDKLNRKFPGGKYAEEATKMSMKCERRMNQRGAGFIMYTYDSLSNYGFSFGRLATTKPGFYINMRLSPGIFTGFNVLYKIDDNGEHDSPWDALSPTGNRSDNANINVSAGVTFKLLYPLWGYVGGGVGYYPSYVEYDAYSKTFNGNLTYSETEYFRNQDQTKFLYFPEAGLKLKLFDAIVLKYGVMYMYDENQIYHQFGAGIKVKN